MNDEQIDDLKQFIAATISQTEANLENKIDLLRKDMQDGFAGVGEVIEELQNRYDKKHTIVDRRLAKLEAKAA